MADIKFGAVTIVEQKEWNNPTQEAATAWGAAFDGFVGGDYKPITYVGYQVVRGINRIFIAEQDLCTRGGERHIVKVTINEFDGNYNIVGIENII